MKSNEKNFHFSFGMILLKKKKKVPGSNWIINPSASGVREGAPGGDRNSVGGGGQTYAAAPQAAIPSGREGRPPPP